MGEEDKSSLIESELRGTTLRVYYYMIQHGEPVGVREVQRALSMSSPSVASHHLTKLVNLDLVEKLGDNSYQLQRVVKVGVLRNFVAYRGVLLPRYFFLASFFTAFVVIYTVLSFNAVLSAFDRFAAIAIGLVGSVFGWYETYRLWKLKLT